MGDFWLFWWGKKRIYLFFPKNLFAIFGLFNLKKNILSFLTFYLVDEKQILLLRQKVKKKSKHMLKENLFFCLLLFNINNYIKLPKWSKYHRTTKIFHPATLEGSNLSSYWGFFLTLGLKQSIFHAFGWLKSEKKKQKSSFGDDFFEIWKETFCGTSWST